MSSKPVTPTPEKSAIAEEEKNHRLPCRGCKADCQYYQQCGGMPWRNLPK